MLGADAGRGFFVIGIIHEYMWIALSARESLKYASLSDNLGHICEKAHIFVPDFMCTRVVVLCSQLI